MFIVTVIIVIKMTVRITGETRENAVNLGQHCLSHISEGGSEIEQIGT